MSRHAPLHEQDPTRRFTDRVGDYARYRPTYPGAAIDAVLHGLGAPGSLIAADIGAGTGISSRLLAERGVRVLAIEPNEAMREQGRAEPIAGPGRIEWLAGTAEQTGLEASSVGLVLCAQAFHWFRPEHALAEFARVLRPGGRVALVWNDRDERDAFTRGYGGLIIAASGRHPGAVSHTRPEPLLESCLFGAQRRREFPHEQLLDEGGLVGRAMSASYVPNAGAAREQLEHDLRALHRAHAAPGGVAVLRYVTRVFLAEKA
ncbi:MAG: class I SAM-dependent methyltransferase [Phycisphaeraceae bacterium]|nr:class I SAM-dependent methyltransferase [Phycisphaeraceae bacterium]